MSDEMVSKLPDADMQAAPVNGGPNPPLNGDALFSGMENALTSACQAASEPGQGQAAAFRSLA